MVIFRGVNFYPRQVESLVVGRPGVSHEYQVLLERGPEGGDRMKLLVEVTPEFAPETLRGMERDFKDVLNITPEVTILREGEIPRPQGKAVRIVDRRQGP
jgi:phenylacetate-CoA ligase